MFGCFDFSQMLPQFRKFRGKVSYLFQGESGYHRLRIAFDQLIGSSKRVGFFQQQPILFFLRHARQGPQSPHLVPEKFHFELTPFELFHRVAGFGQTVLSAIPDDDRARAVVIGRNDSLEVGVFDGVILNVDRQPLLVSSNRRSFRHRPTFQNAVHFQS